MASMPHLVRWHEELGDFGLVLVAPHVQRATPEEVKAKAQSLGVHFAVVGSAAVPNGNDIKGIPHCMLFDHTGKCLYRGAPSGLDAKVRSAVGAALVEATGKSSFTKAVTPLVESLKKGQAPAGVLQKAVALQKSNDAATAEEAKLLVGKLSEGGQKQLDEASSVRKDDPLAAYDQLRHLAGTFKGTPVGSQAADMLNELKNDKAVAAELKARPSLESVKKLDAQLGAQAESKKLDPKGADFQKAFAGPLKQMRTTLQQMQKSWPEAKATQEAAGIADKYAVAGK
jgi:hypothetical protein